MARIRKIPGERRARNHCLTPRMPRLTTRMLTRLTTRMSRLLSIMVVLNAVGIMGVALNASVGLMPTVTGMFATTWEILTGLPKATALTTAMGTEDLMRSDQSVGIVTCARIRWHWEPNSNRPSGEDGDIPSKSHNNML